MESWVSEFVDTPSGPAGRRARWHETLSKFDIEVQYIPGKSNIVADAMSRYAYPASKALQDCSWHGSLAHKEEMRHIIEEELKNEKLVGVIFPKVDLLFPKVLCIFGNYGNPSIGVQTDPFVYVKVIPFLVSDTQDGLEEEKRMLCLLFQLQVFYVTIHFVVKKMKKKGPQIMWCLGLECLNGPKILQLLLLPHFSFYY